jgi:hypothetical protein
MTMRCWFVLTLALAACAGCDDPPAPRPEPPPPRAEKKEIPKRVEVARNIFLEIEGDKRRVLVLAQVCMQKGPLELLLTRKGTKEHEAILAADVDARELQKALILARAEPGSPVRFDPKYVPASGPVIKVTVEYDQKGKTISAPAQEWIRDASTARILKSDWVFGGSRLVKNPLDEKKPIFLANDGDLICISNFESALLDLPIKSSKANAELAFETNTERIPPLETKVTVVLEPVLPKKPR